MSYRITAGLWACLGCCLLTLASSVNALDQTEYDELNAVFDSARVQQADVFAPRSFEKASRELAEAADAIERNKRQSTLDQHVRKSREFIENALKATQLAKVSLSEYLPPRDKARDAKAPSLTPELYQEAEEQFLKATRKVEDGDVKGGLKEAEKAVPLFSTAELEGIRADILGGAEKLIAAAEADEAQKFALATLNKARGALEKGNAILNNDRYDRDAAEGQAAVAEYEARHASSIAQSVRSLERNDQAWEKLMLVYEIQMNRVGERFGLETLPFDEGPIAAADTLVARIRSLQEENNTLFADNTTLEENLRRTLKGGLQRIDQQPATDDPVGLAEQLAGVVDSMVSVQASLTDSLQERASEMAELEEQHEEMSAELSVRLERERRFREAKTILDPSEGEVLFNAANDIVLRLSGLSFAPGKSDLTDEHMPLLDKVKQTIKMFPEARLLVEGHTDATGDNRSNQTLSEKRAYAVMQYLRESLMIPADRITALGFGSDKPIASNQTADGRAKNRRIDVIIMQ